MSTTLTIDQLKEHLLETHDTTYELMAIDFSALTKAAKMTREWHDLITTYPLAKGALVVFLPYTLFYGPEKTGYGRLASIGVGQDYHTRIEGLLRPLETLLKDQAGLGFSKLFVDKHGLSDKWLAFQSGQVTLGKNNLLLHPEFGTAFNVGYLLLDKVISPSQTPVWPDLCGTCQKCIMACPTQALSVQKGFDPTRCRSYINQRKGLVQMDACVLMADWLYGCDICQWACPYNQLKASENGSYLALDDLLKLSGRQFNTTYAGYAFGYLGATRLKRNALIVGHRQGACGVKKGSILPRMDHPLLDEQMALLEGQDVK